VCAEVRSQSRRREVGRVAGPGAGGRGLGEESERDIGSEAACPRVAAEGWQCKSSEGVRRAVSARAGLLNDHHNSFRVNRNQN
jgi:hypothetical protein